MATEHPPLTSTLRLVPGPEWGKVSLRCQILLAAAQPFRSIEIIGRSYFFPQASCLHFIMCIVLDPLQKEKWPFMVSTKCGQKLDQADIELHMEMENIHGEHPHFTQREGEGSRQQRWAQRTECTGDLSSCFQLLPDGPHPTRKVRARQARQEDSWPTQLLPAGPLIFPFP